MVSEMGKSCVCLVGDGGVIPSEDVSVVGIEMCTGVSIM